MFFYCLNRIARSAFWIVSRPAFHLYGIFLKQFSFHPKCEYAVKYGNVQHGTSRSSGLFPLSDPFDTPHLEFFHERETNILEQTHIPLGKESFELGEGVVISFNRGHRQFPDPDALIGECVEYSAKVSPKWTRLICYMGKHRKTMKSILG